MNSKYLPLSKSWAIRMIFLDMLYGKEYGYETIRHFERIDKHDLSEDIQVALRCAKNYIRKKYVFDVGESGTVCRFLIYVLDEKGKKYKLKMADQLKGRIKKISKNLSKLSVADLQKQGTSQYASAALLLGRKPSPKLHRKCQLAVEARKTYFLRKGEWFPKYDEIIIGQLKNFLSGKKIKNPIAEDYCYMRAFNMITQEKGEKLWPELATHESNRLKEMERICRNFNRNVMAPKDHRVVMAVALRQKSLGLPVRVSNKKCVAKSWPQFWKWLSVNGNKIR